MNNLMKAIEELNKPIEVDGEKYATGFNFVIRENYFRDGDLVVFDANEKYYSGYNEENYYLMLAASEEFGFEPPTDIGEDSIFNSLEEAVKKDFGEKAYLEWGDNVVICVAR